MITVRGTYIIRANKKGVVISPYNNYGPSAITCPENGAGYAAGPSLERHGVLER